MHIFFRAAYFPSQLTEALIGLMSDPMVQVQDSAVWTIGRVCEQIPAAVLNDQSLLWMLLQALVNGLDQEPRVAINACWVGGCCYMEWVVSFADVALKMD